MKITITHDSLPALQGQVKRINKKALRLGLEPIALTISPVYEATKTIHRDGGESYQYQVDVVDVVIPEIILEDGWAFAGTIEVLDSGESTIHRPPHSELVLPERFEHIDAHRCDHCGKRRHRTETYVVYRGEEFKQVGRTCLKDFLGHSPAVYAFVEEVWSSFNGFREDEERAGIDLGGSFGAGKILKVEDCLAWAVRIIDAFGFVSKTRAEQNLEQSTVGLSGLISHGDGKASDELRRQLAKRAPATQERRDEAKAIRAYFAEKRDRSNDYEFKLGQLCRSEIVRERNEGILFSAVASYRRAHGLEQDRVKAANSEWVGAIGQRLRGLSVEFVRARTLPDYGFGEQEVFTFRDAAGNLLEWKTGAGRFEFFESEALSLTGTVKEHREWKGIKSTALSRCVVDPASCQAPAQGW